MIPALSTNTIQSGTGITPSAPWTRSARASSRSERWSNHFAYAVCSEADFGSTVMRVRNMVKTQGLRESPMVPASIAGHSWWITLRA
jgi:hypothetical protein